MIQEFVRLDSNEEIAEGLFLLTFKSDSLANRARPGQFLNIRSSRDWSPLLLRRPFSISRVRGASIELLFNIVGAGTKLLAAKRPGDELDVLGPLGEPFRYEARFDTGVIVAGGLGVAPFPFLTDFLEHRGVPIVTFVGSRAAIYFSRLHLVDTHYSTDDGSKGFKGTVVECLAEYLRGHSLPSMKIFGCGPTKMLAALTKFAVENSHECELSLEGDMACGVGICQGCPVERKDGKKKYALVCTDGPTFNCRDVVLER